MSAEPTYLSVSFVPVTCGECGTVFALLRSLQKKKRETGDRFFCPNGCHVRYCTTENEKLKKEVEKERKRREWAEQNAETARRERDRQERSANAYRGHLTRIKRRVGNGTCPCCKRTFKNLQRHMQSRHPGYDAPPEEA